MKRKVPTNFGLVEPFDCDDPMFALGVEWEQWRQKIIQGTVKTDLCMEQNAVRLQNLLERHGYQAEAQPWAFRVGKSKAICRQWWKVWVGRRKKCSDHGGGCQGSAKS